MSPAARCVGEGAARACRELDGRTRHVQVGDDSVAAKAPRHAAHHQLDVRHAREGDQAACGARAHELRAGVACHEGVVAVVLSVRSCDRIRLELGPHCCLPKQCRRLKHSAVLFALKNSARNDPEAIPALFTEPETPVARHQCVYQRECSKYRLAIAVAACPISCVHAAKLESERGGDTTVRAADTCFISSV